MKLISGLIQGSQDWHTHRVTHWNASQSPAMMGVSKYQTRQDLIKELATGISPEIDADTQTIFDNGHKYEAWARPHAEYLIGEELFPVTGVEGKFSASFDGMTMEGTIIWEHKSMNLDLRAVDTIRDLGIMYKVQMEHQLLVSGAEKCLFMASKFSPDGELLEQKHFWYSPDPVLRGQIIAGWGQLEKDILEYQHIEVIEAPKAEPIRDLPVVSVQVKGELTASNLNEITPYFDRFLQDAIVDLITDDDFALAEAQAKKGREAAKQCDLTSKQVVNQMLSIAEVTRTLEEYSRKFNALALRQEKAVKEQKELRKAQSKAEFEKLYHAHLHALNTELSTVRLTIAPPNFAEAMKGQSRMSSVRSKLSDELARWKITADQMAREYREKLTWFNDQKLLLTLFVDLSVLTQKPIEDFKLAVKARIESHEKAESERLFAAERIRQEEETKKSVAVPVRSQVPPVIPVSLKNDPVIDHQDEIRGFLNSREWGKGERERAAAVLVEFVKFQARRIEP
jgi:putative phage-type endonuclease